MILTTIYLFSIILANISAAAFGPYATIINAFFLIGLDLTARDKLHEKWKDNGLKWKMAALIFAGSLLSWLINQNTARIAAASFLAFSAAGFIDSLVYHFLQDKQQLIKINGSNVFSAAADSIIFPTVAFSSFILPVILGQAFMKICGGFIWSLILKQK